MNAKIHFKHVHIHMGVSKDSGTPKSSILIGVSIINYKPSILGYPHFWKHPYIYIYCIYIYVDI